MRHSTGTITACDSQEPNSKVRNSSEIKRQASRGFIEKICFDKPKQSQKNPFKYTFMLKYATLSVAKNPVPKSRKQFSEKRKTLQKMRQHIQMKMYVISPESAKKASTNNYTLVMSDIFCCENGFWLHTHHKKASLINMKLELRKK